MKDIKFKYIKYLSTRRLKNLCLSNGEDNYIYKMALINRIQDELSEIKNGKRGKKDFAKVNEVLELYKFVSSVENKQETDVMQAIKPIADGIYGIFGSNHSHIKSTFLAELASIGVENVSRHMCTFKHQEENVMYTDALVDCMDIIANGQVLGKCKTTPCDIRFINDYFANNRNTLSDNTYPDLHQTHIEPLALASWEDDGYGQTVFNKPAWDHYTYIMEE